MSHYRDKETLIHLLKGCLGTGILAMPNAFGNAGLALGTFATVLIGILCTYCLHVLVGITMFDLSCYTISIIRVGPETGASPWHSGLRRGPWSEKSRFPYLCIRVPWKEFWYNPLGGGRGGGGCEGTTRKSPRTTLLGSHVKTSQKSFILQSNAKMSTTNPS